MKSTESTENFESLENEIASLCANCVAGKAIIHELVLVPQYVEAIRNFKETIDDRKLYDIIKNEYFAILSNNIVVGHATRVMKSVSKFVTGDKYFWVSELSEDMKHKIELRRTSLRFQLPYFQNARTFASICTIWGQRRFDCL